MKYTIITTWSQEDECYIAYLPDLPGCMSDGATLKEAIQNVK